MGNFVFSEICKGRKGAIVLCLSRNFKEFLVASWKFNINFIVLMISSLFWYFIITVIHNIVKFIVLVIKRQEWKSFFARETSRYWTLVPPNAFKITSSLIGYVFISMYVNYLYRTRLFNLSDCIWQPVLIQWRL